MNFFYLILKINRLGFGLVNILYNLFISRLEAQTLIHPNPISKRDFSGSGPKLSIPNPLGKEYTDLFFHRRYCHQAHHRLRRHAAEDLPELSILKTWYWDLLTLLLYVKSLIHSVGTCMDAAGLAYGSVQVIVVFESPRLVVTHPSGGYRAWRRRRIGVCK